MCVNAGWLNPKEEGCQVWGRHVLQVGDKVMQTRNDYDKDVYNGTVGIAEKKSTLSIILWRWILAIMRQFTYTSP